MNRTSAAPAVGPLLRTWRRRRSLSQLALASDAEISQRHLSFVESGRSVPSREMVLRLAEQLAVPLRERNVLLAAAGYAPVFRERAPNDPALQAAHRAVGLILDRHEPFPALAIDRHWTMLRANAAVGRLVADVDAALLEPPVNVLRLSMHPGGLGRQIVNFRQWREHVFGRLREQIELTADPGLTALLDELRSYPTPPGARAWRPGEDGVGQDVAVPFRLATPDGELSFITTTTVFGTALDITLSELAIELFFPDNEETRAILIAAQMRAQEAE